MGKQEKTISIIDYTSDPGPRYTKQGEDSGEDYYHKVLNCEFHKALEEDKVLTVNLDGPSGYASSFLDEAFGNLVYDFSEDMVRKNTKIISEEEPEWIEMLENETYKEWEKRRKESKEPKKTDTHTPWYRYVNGVYDEKVWIVTT